MQYANAKASTNQHSHLVCPLVIQRNQVVWWLSGTQSCLCPAPTPHRQRRSTSAKLCLHCEMQKLIFMRPTWRTTLSLQGEGTRPNKIDIFCREANIGGGDIIIFLFLFYTIGVALSPRSHQSHGKGKGWKFWHFSEIHGNIKHKIVGYIIHCSY